MFYLLGIFYFISSVSTSTYTVDATFQLSPRWGLSFNIKAPETADTASRSYGFQQNRDVIMVSDIATSEDVSEVNSDMPKKDITTTYANSYKIETEKNHSAGHKKRKKQREEERIKLRGANSDKSSGLRSNNEDISASNDNEDNGSFPRGFTQPLRENEEKPSNKVKRKKKRKHKLYSGERWHPAVEDVKEKKNYKKIPKSILFSNGTFISKWKHHLKHPNHKLSNVSKIFVNQSNELINKSQNFIQDQNNDHHYLADWKEKLKDTAISAMDALINKTKQVINIKTYSLLRQNENDWSNVFKNINDNDFYSTPSLLSLRDEKTTETISKLSQNLQKVKDETNDGLAKLYKELNKESQRIKDNDTINTFTKHILERTLKLFDNMEKKTTEYRWKKKMKYLARNYENKFNEFLRASKYHTIRTRLGTRKVILNAIDVSNRIVNRLVNFMAHDMDKRGLIYSNLTPVMFRAELNKEEEHELKRACKKLGICKAQKGFTQFLTDMLLKMLSVPNDKYKTAFDALINSARKTDFALSPSVTDGIQKRLDYCGRQHVNVQKGMLMIVKNIVANRNTPLVLYADSNPTDSKLQLTLAFLEIINTLDEKVPNDKNNVQDWDNMRREMDEWVQGTNGNVTRTMSRFISHVSEVIKDIDPNSWEIVLRNAKILFS